MLYISTFMGTRKRLVMKASISFQFSYCPLIWINRSWTFNNKINRAHERSLRVVYDDKKATFKDVLCKNKTMSINTRNLQIAFTEMFKVKIGESSSIMQEIFEIDNSNNQNIRKTRGFIPGRGGVGKLVLRYVRTKWMASKMLWNIFCALVRPSTRKVILKQCIMELKPFPF